MNDVVFIQRLLQEEDYYEVFNKLINICVKSLVLHIHIVPSLSLVFV